MGEHYRRKAFLREAEAKDLKRSVVQNRHLQFHGKSETEMCNHEFELVSDLVFKVSNKSTNGEPCMVEILPQDAMVCVPGRCAVTCIGIESSHLNLSI